MQRRNSCVLSFFLSLSLPVCVWCIVLFMFFKSNHFYCHITTAHVPWCVKFLRVCSRQCRNNLHIDSSYLQTYTDDNVQNTHSYTQYTQCTIRHTYSYQNTYQYTGTVCTSSTLCTHIYTHNMRRYNRFYINWICNVMDVHWMVFNGSK